MLERGGVFGRRRKRLLLAAPVAVLAAMLWPSSSPAFVACTFDTGVMAIDLTENEDSVEIVRRGARIHVVVSTDEYGDGARISVPCSGGSPTVANTDLIRIDQAPEAEFGKVELNLSGGPLAPGATPEPDGTGEIEVEANMAAPFGALGITGTNAADTIDFGAVPGGGFGANLNGSESVPDVDVRLNDVEVTGVFGEAGNDVIRASGAPGFSGPLKGVGFVAIGDTGNDTLIGSGAVNILFGGAGRDLARGFDEPDYVVLGSGRDRAATGKGQDVVGSKGGGRDRIRCGAGRDFTETDERDNAKGCEPIKRPKRRHGRRFARFPDKLEKRIFTVLFAFEDAVFGDEYDGA
jgi:hypothetical protein